MAPSFTNLNRVSCFLLNSLTRRGYAAMSEGVGVGRGGVGSSLKGTNKSSTDQEEEKVSWVPDPVTGYYKPENSKEIDVAELRATLLAKK